MTCHWLKEDNFARQSIALALSRFTGSHTYDKIAEFLVNIHSCYELDSTKITHIVTDNGANFMKAFREFSADNEASGNENEDTGEEGQSESIQSTDMSIALDMTATANTTDTDSNEALAVADKNIFYLPKHLSCSAHTLNLVGAKDSNSALDDIAYKRLYRAVTAKCTALSKAVHRSPKNAEIIQEICGRTIPKANTTRWNSEYDSLKTINNFGSNKTNSVMERLKLPKLQDVELQFLSEWVTVMQPLATALDLMQGEYNVESYFGAILPTILRLLKKFDT